MVFKYTGKPLSKKEVAEFLERIRMKPTASYKLNNNGKFIKQK